MKTVPLSSSFNQTSPTFNQHSFPLTTNKHTTARSDDFGQEMITKLLSVGYTRKDLAASLQTSISTISNILSGKSRKTQAKVFTNLFRIYCANCLR